MKFCIPDSIPDDWPLVSLRWLSRIYAGGTPDRSNPLYWEDGDVPWLASGVVNQRRIHATDTFITIEGLRNSSAKWIPPKSLVMALAGQGKTKGMVAMLEISATCNQSLAAIVPGSKLNYVFLYYYLLTKYRQLRGLVGDGLRDGLNLEIIGSVAIPIPPLEEQQAIAHFLDEETKKVDDLIEAKRELLVLLKEKRQAVITHAVTKGLDPNVKLKPSYINWLGNVPDHWTNSRIKWVTQVRGRIGFRGYTTEDLVDESVGALALGGANLTSLGKLNLSKRTYISWKKYYESPEIFVECGDIVVGQRGTCGRPAIIEENIGAATINPSLVLLKNLKVNSGFLCYWLMSSFAQSVFASFLSTTAVPMLSQEQISNVPVCLPPSQEQKVIVSYLDAQTANLDVLSEDVETAIARLEEYRSALIIAAVTGKIDVRGGAA